MPRFALACARVRLRLAEFDSFQERDEEGRWTAGYSIISSARAGPSDRARLLDYDPLQKRDERGRWTTQFMSEAAMEAVADLTDIIGDIKDDPTVEPSRLYGGLAAVTEMFSLPDGRRIVRKQSKEALAGGTREAARHEADAEQLGSLVASALGVKHARVVREDESTIWTEFVDGETMWDYNEIEFRFNASKRMGLLDVLIGNPDRNTGNMIMTDDGVYGIDHAGGWLGAALARGAERGSENEFYAQPLQALGPLDDLRPNKLFAQTLTGESDVSEQREWIDNPLTPADIEITRERLEALRPDFKRLRREDWLDYSLRTLDEIAPYAVAGESIYAD